MKGPPPPPTKKKNSIFPIAALNCLACFEEISENFLVTSKILREGSWLLRVVLPHSSCAIFRSNFWPSPECCWDFREEIQKIPAFPPETISELSWERKPCVSKQCPADCVWRIGRGGSPDRVLKTRFTPSESSAGHSLPPQRAPKQCPANGVRRVL